MPNAGDVLTYTVGGKTDWAPVAQAPFAPLQTITDTIPPSTTRNYDFDLSAAAFLDSQSRFRAEMYGTTKQNAGVPTAHMTGSAFVASDGVYDNENNTITFATAAAGGAANPMPAINNEMTLVPQTCDTALRSGGGSPINIAWTLSTPFARLQVTTTNAPNTVNVSIDIYLRRMVAP